MEQKQEGSSMNCSESSPEMSIIFFLKTKRYLLYIFFPMTLHSISNKVSFVAALAAIHHIITQLP